MACHCHPGCRWRGPRRRSPLSVNFTCTGRGRRQSSLPSRPLTARKLTVPHYVTALLAEHGDCDHQVQTSIPAESGKPGPVGHAPGKERFGNLVGEGLPPAGLAIVQGKSGQPKLVRTALLQVIKKDYFQLAVPVQVTASEDLRSLAYKDPACPSRAQGRCLLPTRSVSRCFQKSRAAQLGSESRPTGDRHSGSKPWPMARKSGVPSPSRSLWAGGKTMCSP